MCSMNAFQDIEHNPRILQNFSMPLHPFPIAQLGNTLFRFISYTRLDFVEVKNPLLRCDLHLSFVHLKARSVAKPAR